MRGEKDWGDIAGGFVIENPSELSAYRGRHRGGIGVFLCEALDTMRENNFIRPESDQVRCWDCLEPLLVVPIFIKIKKVFRPYPILFCQNPDCDLFMEPL